MNGAALIANARWEVQRWIRSQRIFLLLIPPIAGPIGSAIAFLYFHVSNHSTALILGIFVTSGLSALVLLDLSALAVGEDLARRGHLFHFTLPQSRWEILAGRLLVVLGSCLALYAIAIGGVWVLAAVLVPGSGTGTSIMLDPFHLALGVAAMLIFLSAIAVNASVLTRGSSQGLVAGVLAAVVTAGGAAYFLAQGQLTMLFPAGLLVGTAIAIGWSVWLFGGLDS